MKTKICTKCNKKKLLTEFHKHRGRKDGYRHICKECVKQYTKYYRYKDNNKCKNCGKLIKNDAIHCHSCKRKGKLHSEQTKIKLRNTKLGNKNPMFNLKGKSNPSYIDGRTPLYVMIRNLPESKRWSIQIMKRDNYICQMCGCKIGDKVAHHLTYFKNILSEFLLFYKQYNVINDKYILLELSKKRRQFWDINNGITLCKKCHKDWIYIRGNHDKNSNKFSPKTESLVINQNGLKIQCVHDPIYAKIDYDLTLCGHVHNNFKVKELFYCNEIRLIINVGVDVWKMKPVSLEQIISIYHKWKIQRSKIKRWEQPLILKELNKGTLADGK